MHKSLIKKHQKHTTPSLFENFFELGLDEAFSPFLKPKARKWSEKLELKAALFSAFFLVFGFLLSYIPSMEPLSAIFLVGVFFLSGIPSLIESIENLFDLQINIDMLMTLAAFSSLYIGNGYEGGLLLVLFALSGAMEEAVESRASSAIKSLESLSPTTVHLITDDGTMQERSVREVAVGACIRIKAGEVVPLDSTIIEGISFFDLSHITGESFPQKKKEGQSVVAGSKNIESPVLASVDKPFSSSTLANIIELVRSAQEAKPQLQRFFDKFSRKYAISIMAVSAFVALSFPFFFSLPFFGEEGALYRALSFLIAASPCALIIAVPIAYLSGISSCAKKGILLKGGAIFDALASCRLFALDKTGTLTTGNLHLEEITPLTKGALSVKKEALQAAIALEEGAIHPIAKAIDAYGKKYAILPLKLISSQVHLGEGVLGSASSQGKEVLVGIGGLSLLKNQVSSDLFSFAAKKSEELKEKGNIHCFLLFGDALFSIELADTIREEAKEAIESLKKLGYITLMLTGDHEKSALTVAKSLSLDEVLHSLSPEDKLLKIEDLTSSDKVIMCGDGINDAPSLARATVGIAIGGGANTIAMESADVILLNQNLLDLPWLIKKARLCQSIVKQNLILALGAIFIASLLSLLGLIPLWAAVIAHEGGTILVGLNALRLLSK